MFVLVTSNTKGRTFVEREGWQGRSLEGGRYWKGGVGREEEIGREELRGRDGKRAIEKEERIENVSWVKEGEGKLG